MTLTQKQSQYNITGVTQTNHRQITYNDNNNNNKYHHNNEQMKMGVLARCFDVYACVPMYFLDVHVCVCGPRVETSNLWVSSRCNKQSTIP